MSMVELLTRVAQRLQPREFRIAIPPIPALADSFPSAPAEPRPSASAEWSRMTESFIVLLVNQLWQIRKLVGDEETRVAYAELDDVWAAIEIALTELKLKGVEVEDLTGRTFQRDGFRATFVLGPELTVPTILRTEEPRVTWNGKRIQPGRGVVGEPTRSQAASKKGGNV